MNWGEILTQIILGIIGIVIAGLGTLSTYLINKYIKNEKLKTIVNSLNELVKNSVATIYQTYVEALKKGGMFDANAQKQALERCLELVNSNMTNDVKEWLEENFLDVQDYLTGLIEAQIALLKAGGK